MPDAAPAAFEPVHDAHAIEQVTFSLQFSRHLEDSLLAKLQIECGAALAVELPGKSEVRSIGVSIGPQGLVPMSPTSGPDGFVRLRMTPSGSVEKELRVERGGLTFRTTSYTRWAAIWSEAQQYFRAVVSSLPADVSLVAQSLQYVDRFDWSGQPNDCRPGDLIARNSEFVAPHVFRMSDLWHSHFGAFVRLDEFTKRLLLVNLDCVDEEGAAGQPRRSVRITTGVTDILNQPGYTERRIPVAEVIGYLDERQNAAHTVLKNVIADLLTAEMRRKIGIDT